MVPTDPITPKNASEIRITSSRGLPISSSQFKISAAAPSHPLLPQLLQTQLPCSLIFLSPPQKPDRFPSITPGFSSLQPTFSKGSGRPNPVKTNRAGHPQLGELQVMALGRKFFGNEPAQSPWCDPKVPGGAPSNAQIPAGASWHRGWHPRPRPGVGSDISGPKFGVFRSTTYVSHTRPLLSPRGSCR